MSELTKIGREVSEINGILKSTLPTLATKPEVQNMISSQYQICQEKEADKPKPNGKTVKILGGVIVALTTLLITLTQIL